MKKTAILLMVLTLGSKVLGLLRDVALSYYYGTSHISDAYLISLTIPKTLFAMVGIGIATSYIPIYSTVAKERSIDLADQFTSNITNFMMAISAVVVITGMVFAPSIVKVFASGFEGETMQVAVMFTRITILAIFFSTLTYVFNGYLQVKNSFLIPALMGLSFNVVTIVSIVLSTKLNVAVLAVGSVIAMGSQFCLMLPFIHAKGYRHKLLLDVTDENVRKMLLLSLPVIFGMSVNQINKIIDRTIASQLAVGGISALNYANHLNLFIQGVFVISITTVMYPIISRRAAEKDFNELKRHIVLAINGINLLVVPATAGAIVFAEPLVSLLFGRGAFDYQAVYLTSNALLFYSLGMVGFGLREVLSRAFYSLQDTKTPMINASIAVVINIILNIVLSRLIGISGLALATSLSAVICSSLLFISLRKKIGEFDVSGVGITFAKISFATVIMGVIAKVTFDYLQAILSQNSSLVLSIGVGATVYFIVVYFIKIDDVEVIMAAIREKFNKHSNGKAL